MLIEYSVQNFRSIREKQTLRMMKFEPPESETNEFTLRNFNNLRINRSAAIYGPNAAGKTNLLEGIRIVTHLVYNSAAFPIDTLLPITPFKFDQRYKNSPSEFEFLFVADDDKIYHFGLSATSERVLDEWLNVYINQEPVSLYSRKYDKKKGTYKWYMNEVIGNDRETWKNVSKQNSLFISVAIQLNCKYLLPAFNWFSQLKISRVGGWDPSYTAGFCINSAEELEQIKGFLNAAHLDISDIRYTPDSNKIEFAHKNAEGNDEFLDFFTEESHGTQKLFSQAGPMVEILRNGHVVIIDELENQLHIEIQKFLISIFHDEEINKMNAQLIFTTHNVALLDLELFNNEQLWICEKDKYQSTTLTSIGEFESVEGVTNIEKAYLRGRFGGVPIVNPTEFRSGEK